MATKDTLNDARSPSSLQKTVILRVERLGDDSRRVLQSASVIGFSFEYRLLWGLLGPVNKRLLDQSLKELEKFDFIFEKSKFPQRVFQFRNEALREILYDYVSPHQKLHLHGEIAEHLEEIYKNDSDGCAVLIASHYLKSDKLEKALEYTVKAGEISFNSYRLREALDFFIKGHDILSFLKNLPKYNFIQRKIFKFKCEIYILLGKYDLAVSSLNSIKAILPPGEIEDVLETKRIAGEILIERGEFHKAKEILDEVALSCREKGLSRLLLKTLVVLGFLEIFRENLVDAKKVCDDGLSLCSDSDRREKGSLLTFIGLSEYYQSDYRKAFNYFTEALEIFNGVQDKALIGECYCNIAMSLFKTGNFKDAYENYQKSLTILGSIEYQRALIITRMNLAVLFDHIGNYEEALKEYEKVLREAEELGNTRVLMMVLCNLGEVFLRLGQYKSAEKYLKDSLQFSGQVGSLFWKMSGLLYLGALNAELGKRESARNNLDEALKMARKLGERGKEFEIELELLTLDLGKKENAVRAKELYDEICTSINLGSSEDLRLKALLLLGSLEYKNIEPKSLNNYLDEGLSLSLRLNREEWAILFIIKLARHHDSQNNLKIAKEYSKKALDKYDDILIKIPEVFQKTIREKRFAMDLFSLLRKYNLRDKTINSGGLNEKNINL